jgi:hypothetical protein
MAADSTEYTVTVDGVDFPTWQIDDLDDGGVVFPVDPTAVDAFSPIKHGEEVEVETPAETFTGEVEMVALEHGELSIRVGRREAR